jgi:hypothetical protein
LRFSVFDAADESRSPGVNPHLKVRISSKGCLVDSEDWIEGSLVAWQDGTFEFVEGFRFSYNLGKFRAKTGYFSVALLHCVVDFLL